MTPDQRLNQIEPLLAEHSAQLDQHTAQLRRIASGIQIITEAIGKQSDNITFLLTQQAEMKDQIDQIKQAQNQQGETLAAILNILQGRSDN